MKTIGKQGLCGYVEFALAVLMLVAAGLMISLPWTIPAATGQKPGMPEMWFEKYLVVLLVSGVLAELILWQARGILRNINRGRPFGRDMCRRFRIIGIECLSLALFYFVAVFVVTRFFMVAVFVTFSVVGLLSFVFAELFRQAGEYKKENDMTI